MAVISRRSNSTGGCPMPKVGGGGGDHHPPPSPSPLHHLTITYSSPHHQLLITSSSPLHHRFITSSSPPHHLLITSSSAPHHLFITSSSPPYHLLITSSLGRRTLRWNAKLTENHLCRGRGSRSLLRRRASSGMDHDRRVSTM